MKTPALLLGLAIIFWGWQSGLWIPASLMALIFEGSRLIPLRWDLSTSDFRRISDLCTILLVILLVYLFVSDTSAYFLFVLLKWLPIVFFPLLAAQAYATSDRIDIRALFLLLRKKKKRDEKTRPIAVNLTYPYFAICILSASAANVRDAYFYIGMLVLSTLAFWFMRSKRFSPLLWICLIAIAGGAGVAGNIGLHSLQLALEQKGLEWFSDFNRQDLDPFHTKTAIGDIGTLKPSNRIVFRVKPGNLRISRMLLIEAIYNRYSFSMWFVSNPAFTPVQPDKNRTTWRFQRGSANGSAITVSSYLYHGQGVLKLPDGAFQVDQLPVLKMERNQFGTVKVEGGPGLVSYKVQFDPGLLLADPPTANDLQIPAKEEPVLNKIVSQLKLEEKSPQEIIKSIEIFFQTKFRYSLALTGKGYHSTPISSFLLQTRSGHCEYFATSTVLLLRASGIPARYVKGYSVHEFSRLENRFIVRDRHAHAWSLVFLNGAWHRLDTTPASWTSIEDAAVPGWKLISDFGSLCRFKLTVWLGHLSLSSKLKHLWWLVLPVALIMARRFYLKRQVKRLNPEKSPETSAPYGIAGSDSEFYLIEKALNKAGFARHPTETLQNWIRGLSKNPPALHGINDLKSLLALHYRYRFDPKGIKTIERAALKSGSRSWLDKYNKFINSRNEKP